MRIGVGVKIGNMFPLNAFSGELDNEYDSILAFWSMRRVFSDYTGKAIRVRRSSDNDELVIGFDGKDLDQAAVSLFANGSDLFIKTWYDQKGNWVDDATGTDGLDVFQSFDSAQPKLILNSMNSKPSILFDGNNDALGRDYIYTSSGSLAFMVVGKDVSIVGFSRIISMPGQTDYVDWNNVRSVVPVRQNVSPNVLDAYRDHAAKGKATHPGINVPYIVTSAWDGTNHKFYIYGGTPDTVANSGIFDTLRLRFGCGMGGPDVNGGFSNVHLSEVMLASSITNPIHNAIGNSISEYYAIDWNDVS